MDALKKPGEAKDLFARCAGVYFLLSALALLAAKRAGIGAIKDREAFLARVPLARLLIFGAIGVLFVSLLYYIINIKPKTARFAPRFDPALLFLGAAAFVCVLVWGCGDFYLTLGACLVVSPFLAFAASEYVGRGGAGTPVSPPAAAILIGAAGIAVAVFVCVTAAAKHKIFYTSCYDMGIFAQAFHSMAKDLSAVTTCERGEALSHFNIHASYILYLLLPVYKLFPGEITLIAAQGVLTVSGIVPFYLIAARRGFGGKALTGVCGAYLFCVGLLAPCFYHFHENAFLPPLLLWMLWVGERKKLPLFLLFAALVCVVKEDAPLYVICAGAYFAIEEKGRDRLPGVIAAAGATAYLIFINNWLLAHGDGQMMTSSRFGTLTTESAQGLGGVVVNTLCDPGYFFSLLISEKSLLLLLQMLLPLAFLPLLTRKLHRFLLVLPFVIMNLTIGAGYGYAAELGYQYTFGPAAMLLYLTLVNLSEFSPDRRKVLAALSGALSLIAACAMVGGQAWNRTYYKENEERFIKMEECLDAIPPEGAVLSNTFYLPHIADRDEIYQLNESMYITDGDRVVGIADAERYDYIVLNRKDEKNAGVIPALEKCGFTVFGECGDVVIYSPSPRYISAPRPAPGQNSRGSQRKYPP